MLPSPAAASPAAAASESRSSAEKLCANLRAAFANGGAKKPWALLERLRRSLPASANCSGAAAEQWNLRNRCERQLGVHRGRQARNEIESALVIQMACTHSAAMAVLNRLGGASGDRTVAAMASAAGRLLRTYATQVEALRRLRNGGSQTVRVEHVHVNEGGQALIGNVSSER